MDVLISSARRQALEESGPETLVLPDVGDDEGNFCIGRCHRPLVAGHSDDLTVDDGHQRFPIVVVDGGEVLDFTLGELWVGTEIAAADGFR